MKTSQKLHASLLVLINFLLLHYVISSLPLRFDFTADDTYTLSESSKSMLSKIEEPLNLDFYYTSSIKDLPIRIKNFANRVEQMLKQYSKASASKIRLKTIDPEADSPEEENAVAAGLQGISTGNGTQVFLGLVASQGDNEKTIPFFDWNKEAFLEYDISKVIYEAQLFAKPTIGLLSGLPLKAPATSQMPGQPAAQDQYIVDALEGNFAIEVVDAASDDLPSGLDLLAVIHPIGLSESMAYAIDQHVLSGKPLFVAVDPSSVYLRSTSQQNAMMFGGQNPNASSNLESLFQAWGLEYDPNQLLADINMAYTQPRTMQPTWLQFGNDQINKDLLPANELDNVLLLEAGSLELSEESELAFEPALQTTTSAGHINSMMAAYMQPSQLLREINPEDKVFTAAGLLSGTFKTAFPDGQPQTEEDAVEGDEQNDPASTPDHLASGESSVFAIADTDWTLDQFSVQRMNFLGMPAVQPINDNATLGSNFIDYLGGSQDLIGIRGKGNTERIFEVVRAMEVEAQQAFQAKLQEMESQQAEIRSQIQQIVSQQQSSGLIVASPELQDSLDEFREQEVQLNRSIREIRRNMRGRIDQLGVTLGLLNLLWAPIGLAVFGILFFKSRKRQKISE